MNRETRYVRTLGDAAFLVAGILAAGAAVVAVAGCSPGLWTRQALSQTKIYEWRDDGGFWVEGKGPQEEIFTMMQGVIAFNPDGTVNLENSHVEYYLHAEPSADAAVDANATNAAAYTAMTAELVGLIRDLVPTIQPSSPESPENASDE
ncbi:MAG TPA: hypothetical protein ENI79_01350 [Rhodospirillales bacterium]|nr:hypothetical protein [Rhodospirillales bacterium]